MSIFPFISGDDGINIEKVDNMPIYKECAWDFVNDKAIFVDGSPKIVYKNEAIKVWIYKAIKTVRYNHEIYTWDYGCEIESLIGKGYYRGFVESEARRYIEEAILINNYIIKIHNLDVNFKGDVLYVDGDIETVYGRLKYSV